ncbi:molybdate ABC transporter permease subunit [Acidithiobacillus sp. IBUN Pt1247-S3]|uniref:molybdate ABC transporter permease subunit n=1 Tax=Acidithiobacillus sp. IBUN Pt1247-S3 TaxID=3166642 RepID=UPI0034E3B50A
MIIAILIAPFSEMFLGLDWQHLQFAPNDLQAIRTSLVYSGFALLLCIVFGTPLAWWMAHRRYRWSPIVEALILLPLLTPPLALGILLASFFGPYAPAGALLSRWGVELVNTAPAFIMAQVYAAMPYYVLSARAAFEGVPRELEEMSHTLGKSSWQTFWIVTLPLARSGLTTATALGWVRAMGEFGVVLIVAYYPMGIPVKLYQNLEDIGLSAVYPLLWIFFLVAIPFPLWIGLRARKRSLA